MPNNLDPDTLKIPAFMRKKAIVSQAKQKLILTALDRKEAGLKPNSTRATATVKKSASSKYNQVLSDIANGRKKSFISQTPRRMRRKYKRQNAAQADFNQPLQNQQQSYTNPQPEPDVPQEPTLPQKLTTAGTTTHYLNKIDVAIIMLTQPLSVGDKIYIQTDTGLFLQEISEMQIDRRPVLRAQAGDHIGLKVNEPAQIDGKIFKLEN